MLDISYDDWFSGEDVEKIPVESTPFAQYIYDKKGDIRKRALDDTILHSNLVSVFLDRLARALVIRGCCHDWTKFDFPNLTFDEHMKIERHHLNIPTGVHDDVDLLDVLEFVADCTSAGLQRKGEVDLRYLQVPDDVLQKAVYNTAFKLVMMCRLEVAQGVLDDE